MIIPVHYMRDGKVRLRSFIRNLNRDIERYEGMDMELPEDTFSKFKREYYSLSLDMLNAIEEIRNGLQAMHNIATTIQRASDIKEEIVQTNAELKDYNPKNFLRRLNKIYDSYGGEDVFGEFSSGYYKNSLRSIFNISSNPDLDPTAINSMFEAIPKDRKFSFLDASGRNPANIKLMIPDGVEMEIDKYALNVTESQHFAYKQCGYDRIALGKLKGGTFSNEVFDVMFLSPKHTADKTGDVFLDKEERNLIRDTFKLLRPGGILMLAMPAYRFYRDVSTLVAKSYKDVQIRKSCGFDDTKMVYITGIRKTKEEVKDLDDSIYKVLRNLATNRDLDDAIDKPFEPMTLPDGELSVSMFRGSILNKDEMATIFNSSSCMEQFFRSQQYRDVTLETREPLLPFTTGQLGLVLTSGSLDGIIDEGDGNYHVVKGRVVKSKSIEQNADTENNEVTYTETIANRVEINVITADGALKQLA